MVTATRSKPMKQFTVELRAFQHGATRIVNVPDANLTTETIENLEEIYRLGQNDFQNVPGRCSVSKGDIIQYYDERYVVDSVGFTRISNEPPNARFWTFYHNSWVKLTLRFGQSLAFGFSAPDDEGYSFESNLYTYQRDDRFSDTAPLIVLNEWSNGGRDCDGSIRRSGAHFSPLDQLAATESYMEQGEDKSRSHFQGRRIRRPEWQEFKECRVHDQFAEAAGY